LISRDRRLIKFVDRIHRDGQVARASLINSNAEHLVINAAIQVERDRTRICKIDCQVDFDRGLIKFVSRIYRDGQMARANLINSNAEHLVISAAIQVERDRTRICKMDCQVDLDRGLIKFVGGIYRGQVAREPVLINSNASRNQCAINPGRRDEAEPRILWSGTRIDYRI